MFPLTASLPGSRVRILQVLGGRGMQQRLWHMGLRPGTELRVIANAGGGPVLVAANGGARFGLGWGMAQRILVEEVREAAVHE
ncbi:FeoA family protein [Ammonifex degensii KC4]|uniref:FeoA family protein n=1 Tax=Ammonifex degensii (strain DSM 10501 / KC4) TaxID=429009 RepID=C9RC05_AMMDK|nr:FeoA domain-containing protein [Ammonifex degensii]ACX51782.1 FeoA family protein [Ammonifex degensii KC4]